MHYLDSVKPISAENSRMSYDGLLWYVYYTKATYPDCLDFKSVNLSVSVTSQELEKQFSDVNSTF